MSVFNGHCFLSRPLKATINYHMFDLKNLKLLLDHIAEDKGLAKERILDAIEQALAAAYKREYGKRGQVVKAKLDVNTGATDYWQVKTVVTEDHLYTEEELEELREKRERGEEMPEEEEEKIRFNPDRHILLEEAREIKKDAAPGEELEMKLEGKGDFGRIAAQTAKQVILQKIKEAERESILGEFKSKEDQIISGIVQRVESRMVFVEIGKTIGVLPREEQVPGEFYRIGQRLKFYVVRVEDNPRGPSILLSRSHPKLVSKLFELEVPEIEGGSVEIKGIAREPGSRSKIAVDSAQDGVDPVGAMVGQRGTRVSAVITELGGEKIDIIEWDEDWEEYVGNALSPARALEVELEDGRATVTVPEDQLSLAIGRDGQNVRLAARLTGYRIDIKTPEGKEVAMEEAEEGGEEEQETVQEEPEEGSAETEEKKTERSKDSDNPGA